MSFRHFLHLLNGLSTRSRFAQAITAKRSRSGIQFGTPGESKAFAASGYGMGSSS